MDYEAFDTDWEELEELFDADDDSVFCTSCTVCGEEYDVEPDADFLCGQCGEGRVQSPLIRLGVI